MYVITAPFIIVGLIAKIFNNKRKNAEVHSNQEPQLCNLVEAISQKIIDNSWSILDDEFLASNYKTSTVAKEN
jgi:hypothetical protein